MTSSTLLLVTLATVACATVVTWLVRRYALSRNVLDVPNARSSHTRPTPRGGGAAIVVAWLAAVVSLWGFGALPAGAAAAVIGAAGAVAVIGFVDDHRPIPARIRLLVHFGAAGWALYFIGLPGAWQASAWAALPASAGYGLALMTLVWLLNLWNFMDGIDGLAAGEAVFVCAAGVLLRLTDQGPLPSLTMLLAAASLGFLFWNFPPASIFMGDVGSGFLGIALAMTGFIEFFDSVRHGAAWLVLPAFFTTDATVTLLRRWRQGIPVATAHRTHAYQHAAQRFGSHRTVTMAVAALNVCYLLPLALLVQHQLVGPGLGLALAYVPVTIAVWMLGAGIDRRAA